jgi:serine/threonine-protein kinase RsbW
MTTIIYPASYNSLAQISKDVSQAGISAGLSAKDIYDVQVAIDEACTNIIEHGYGGECEGEISCTFVVIENGLKIILQDQGCWFDPNLLEEPDTLSNLDERKERGLGVFFMRKLMDVVIFEPRTDDGNTLVMIKYRQRNA